MSRPRGKGGPWLRRKRQSETDSLKNENSGSSFLTRSIIAKDRIRYRAYVRICINKKVHRSDI